MIKFLAVALIAVAVAFLITGYQPSWYNQVAFQLPVVKQNVSYAVCAILGIAGLFAWKLKS